MKHQYLPFVVLILLSLLLSACGKQASNPVYITKNDSKNAQSVIVAYNEVNDPFSYEVLVVDSDYTNLHSSTLNQKNEHRNVEAEKTAKLHFKNNFLGFLTLKHSKPSKDKTGFLDKDLSALQDTKQQKFESIWQRISSGLVLTDFSVNLPIVKRHIKKILKHNKAFANATRRAEPFLHMIVEEVERRNLPMELALLPFVESHYHTTAVSPRSKASGLWQFTRRTGRFYGLEQNWWYDGRFDVYESTHAALDLLEDMYARYDDWYLALAAYNWGMGNLDRALRKNGRKDDSFWNIKVPAETRQYVPKLLAYAYIIRSHQHYDLLIHPVENRPKVATISIEKPYELVKLADAAEVSIHEFRKLNPAHKRWATKPNKAVKLLIPHERLDGFKNRIKKIKTTSYSHRKYTVRRGDSLYEIALNNGTDVRTLKETNQLRNDIIRIGQKLIIPTKTL